MGPGTGLGTSVLYTEIVHGRPKITVLAAEGGHIDPPVLDQETLDYL